LLKLVIILTFIFERYSVASSIYDIKTNTKTKKKKIEIKILDVPEIEKEEAKQNKS